MVIVKNHENRLMECLFNNRQRETESNLNGNVRLAMENLIIIGI